MTTECITVRNKLNILRIEVRIFRIFLDFFVYTFCMWIVWNESNNDVGSECAKTQIHPYLSRNETKEERKKTNRSVQSKDKGLK